MAWLTRLGARLLFIGAFALGLQVPAVVDQYGQRVAAHQLEAQRQLDAFGAIAERFFAGDYQALIEHHRQSRDPVFRAEAEVLQEQFLRAQQLARERAALEVPLPWRATHVALAADAEILALTLQDFRPGLPLQPAALLFGLLLALAALGVCWLPLRLYRWTRRRQSLPRAEPT